MSATFEALLELDRDLVARGHHPLTPWWREQLERWYRHPTARTLVARVGRGGAKSHTSVKVSLAEVLFGDWRIPPGEVHYWAYASTSIMEARQRLRLIEQFLTDLGIPYTRSGEEIVLRGAPRGWRVFAATIGAVKGFRCFGRSADELATWHSADSAANPAHEVVASMTAMAVTHPGARCLLISSPLGLEDYHAKRYALGDTDDQIVCTAPSWVANPGISEAQCRAEEPDPRVFRREYEAIPQASVLAAFDEQAIERAFQQPDDLGEQCQPFGVIDASSGKKDTWAWGVAAWHRAEDDTRRLVFLHIDGIEARYWDPAAGGEQAVSRAAQAFRRFGVTHVYGDQREQSMLLSAFARRRFKFHEISWTAKRKERAVMVLRRWLADGRIVLPQHVKLRSELLSFEEHVVAATGGLTFRARGTGHDDYVSLLLTAAMVDSEPEHHHLTLPRLPGSPAGRLTMLEALRLRARREREAKQLPYWNRRPTTPEEEARLREQVPPYHDRDPLPEPRMDPWEARLLRRMIR